MPSNRNTFQKHERLCSVIAIDRLFNGGSRSYSSFPIRIVYRLDENPAQKADIQVMITVSKRHFHHAVQRNRVKRQIREAYRKHKQLLWQALEGQPQALTLAFIWQDNNLWSSAAVEKKIVNLLNRLVEKIKDVPTAETAE